MVYQKITNATPSLDLQVLVIQNTDTSDKCV